MTHHNAILGIDFTASVRTKADSVMTAEEITEARKSYKTFLEERLAAVPFFKPAVPTPNDQWREMVWPVSEMAKKDPDTGVSTEVLRDVGKASVTIPSEGFVRFHHSLYFGILTRPRPRKFILVLSATLTLALRKSRLGKVWIGLPQKPWHSGPSCWKVTMLEYPGKM